MQTRCPHFRGHVQNHRNGRRPNRPAASVPASTWRCAARPATSRRRCSSTFRPRPLRHGRVTGLPRRRAGGLGVSRGGGHAVDRQAAELRLAAEGGV